MIIYPAIDILDGKGVRLKKGKFNEVTVYGSPLDLSKRWEREGCKFLHIVDLNGAVQNNNNLKDILEIKNNTNLSIQLGGGIRTLKYAKKILNLGIDKIIIATAAIKNFELLKSLVNEYGDRIIVGIDAKDQMVAVEGWKEISSIKSLDLIKKLEDIGIKYVVYTDISKDGMLQGPNFDIYKRLVKETNINIIASGGITTYEDVSKLRKIGVYGGIIGKSLYESIIDLKEIVDVN